MPDLTAQPPVVLAGLAPGPATSGTQYAATGQVLAIRNPVVMDAAGTWQLAVAVDWYEAPAMDYTG